jgi:uncharacterized membrane protein
VFPVLSAFSAGTADFLYKRSQLAGAEPNSFYRVHAAIFASVIGVFTLTTPCLRITSSTVLFSVVCSILAFVSFYAMLLALQEGEGGMVITLIRLGFAITALLAILLLNETLTQFKVWGLMAAVIVVGLYSQGSMKPDLALPHRALWLALLAMAAIGVQRFVYKVALLNGVDGSTLLLLQAMLVLLMTFTLLPRKRIINAKVTIGYAGVCACLQATALWLMLTALNFLEASIVVPLGQMSFVVTTLLASRWLGELMSPCKIAGTGFAIATVLLLGMSS